MSIGQQWGALENLNYLTYVLTGRDTSERAIKMKETILRYSRLSMFLTFMALQGKTDLSHLVIEPDGEKDSNGLLKPQAGKGLLTPHEKVWLDATAIGTRPLMVISWMSNFFEDLLSMGYKYGDVYHSTIVNNLMSLRYGPTISLYCCIDPFSLSLI